MARIELADRNALPEEFKERFDIIEKSNGYIPNSYMQLAHRPPILKALMDLSKAVIRDEGTLDRGFRFLKAPAKLLLNKAAAGQSDIDAADLSNLLARFGIELIAERIESETMVVDLLDYDVKFGQGFLFSPPRPVRPEALHGQTPAGGELSANPTAHSTALPAMPQATALDAKTFGGTPAQPLTPDDPASVLAAPDFVPQQNMPA